MQLARVIGEVVATIKDDNLTGIKLMVLQPIAASGDPAGRTLIALDSVGAGVGEPDLVGSRLQRQGRHGFVAQLPGDTVGKGC